MRPRHCQRREAWLEDPANDIVTLADTRYPRQLLQIPDPPPLLHVKGRVELLSRPALAIVGSRNATAQGMANAEAFARTLSDAGLTIVSGLALGIDAAAHRGGLAGSASSVAVLGTGADIVYPARNRALAHELAAGGALVSEFPLGMKPLAGNFPRRNRLISGLALGCLVVEAAADSGSLITARLAAEQGREVFAIPGSIHSPLAKGCHALIKQGAKLVESARDILEELRMGAPSVPAPAPAMVDRPARTAPARCARPRALRPRHARRAQRTAGGGDRRAAHPTRARRPGRDAAGRAVSAPASLAFRGSLRGEELALDNFLYLSSGAIFASHKDSSRGWANN